MTTRSIGERVASQARAAEAAAAAMEDVWMEDIGEPPPLPPKAGTGRRHGEPPPLPPEATRDR